MALTTDDLSQIKTVVLEATRHHATKDDLKGLATKADLDRLESRLAFGMGLIERDAMSRLDDHDTRLTRLEQAR